MSSDSSPNESELRTKARAMPVPRPMRAVLEATAARGTKGLV